MNGITRERPSYNPEEWGSRQFSLTKAMQWISEGKHETYGYWHGVKKFLDGTYDHPETYEMGGERYFAVNPYQLKRHGHNEWASDVLAYKLWMDFFSRELETWGWVMEVFGDSAYQPEAYEIRFKRLAEVDRDNLTFEAQTALEKAQEAPTRVTKELSNLMGLTEAMEYVNRNKNHTKYCKARIQALQAKK